MNTEKIENAVINLLINEGEKSPDEVKQALPKMLGDVIEAVCWGMISKGFLEINWKTDKYTLVKVGELA